MFHSILLRIDSAPVSISSFPNVSLSSPPLPPHAHLPPLRLHPIVQASNVFPRPQVALDLLSEEAQVEIEIKC
jgi:hypothetical protein